MSEALLTLSCFSEARSLVDPLVRTTTAHLPPLMLRVIGYHRGWCDAEGNTPGVLSGSTFWMAAMTMLGGSAVGGNAGQLTAAAVSMELMHDAAVIQDDVVDQDATRYGSPAVWKVFGAGQAVTCASALHVLATRALLSVGEPMVGPCMTLFDRALGTAINAQSEDLAIQGRAQTSWEECVRISQEKTGALIGCAAALGALLGGGTPGQVEALYTYGYFCGYAGQILNDVDDVRGVLKVMGFGRKRSDLRARRITIPIAGALDRPGPAADRLHALYALDRPLSEEEGEEAADLVERAGGVRRAVEARDEAVRLAIRSLSSLTETRARRELEELVDVATRI